MSDTDSEKQQTHKAALAYDQPAVRKAARAISEEESMRVRRKIDWHLMPLLCALYMLQFIDKTTLNNSAILGLKEDTHLTSDQYNWLGTIFYLGYLVFEWPQSLALQRFPASKWMAANVFVWSVAHFCQAACTNFAGLFVCRLFLGICEGSITAGFLVLTSMFYTNEEASRRVGYWFLMCGSAQIFSGLVSWACYHMDPTIFAPWKAFMIICGGLTLVVAALFWFFIPDSPMTARFLTSEERDIAIQRLAHQSSGVENKTWKKYQFMEALTDWKPWAFFLIGCFAQLPNSLTLQTSLIIKSFGFSVARTALLGMVIGAIEIVSCFSSAQLMKRFANKRWVIGSCFYIPCLVSSIMMVALPWGNKGALLAAMYMNQIGGASSFIIALGWCTSTNTGHTKKTTANAMLLIGYCLGNLLSPQMWKAQYAPRYYVPWGVIMGAYVVCPSLFVFIGLMLRRENRRRDQLAAAGEISVEKHFDEEGNAIDPTFLDLTDHEYRYPI